MKIMHWDVFLHALFPDSVIFGLKYLLKIGFNADNSLVYVWISILATVIT